MARAQLLSMKTTSVAERAVLIKGF